MLAAATILSGLLFALATGPANADTTTVTLGSSAPTAASATSSVIGSTGGSGTNPLNVITCTGQIDNPHKSTHFPGTINVEDSIRCTAPVAQLSIETGEYRNGILVPNPKFTSNTGQSVLAGAFATPCVTGVYIGAAAMNVIFPPGYFPPFGGFIVESPPVPIKC
jgi:pectate lyase